MKIIVVDDERHALNYLIQLCRRVMPECEIAAFTDAQQSFAYLAENRVDIAFLDIEMGGLSGIELAQKCTALCRDINIIFVTGYESYVREAFRLHASGYLTKPVRERDLRDELAHLRYPVCAPVFQKRVRVQTFGSFEIFVDGKPVDFSRSKSKECLAYLIDRKGARVSTEQLASILWENRPYGRKVQNNTYRVVAEMMKALKRVGASDMIIKSSRSIAVDAEKFDCDYYVATTGDGAQMCAFTGEYMSNYSWAEFTLGDLYRRAKLDA